MDLAAASGNHKRSTGELVVAGDGEDALGYLFIRESIERAGGVTRRRCFLT
jgi:hypothetical protein